MAKFDLSGVSVAIAMPTHRDLPMGTVLSLLATLEALREKKISHRLEFQIDSTIKVSCNLAARSFLASPFTKMLHVESDMVWDPEAVLRIIALSTKMPIVCGSYAERRETGRVFIAWDGGEPRYNEYGCMPITQCGLGFTIIDRAVIQALTDKAQVANFGEGDMIPIVFHDHVDERGIYMTEDNSFFLHARRAGFQAYLDPNINLGHVGSHTYRTDVKALLQKAKAA